MCRVPHAFQSIQCNSNYFIWIWWQWCTYLSTFVWQASFFTKHSESAQILLVLWFLLWLSQMEVIPLPLKASGVDYLIQPCVSFTVLLAYLWVVSYFILSPTPHLSTLIPGTELEPEFTTGVSVDKQGLQICFVWSLVLNVV